MSDANHWKGVCSRLEQTRGTLKSYVSKWLPVLGLDSWYITVDYNLAPWGEAKSDLAGKAEVEWKYKEATVSFYLSGLTEVDDARLEYIVVHELCHVVVNQMRGSMNWTADDMANEERVVTEVARSFIRARHWHYSEGDGMNGNDDTGGQA